MGEVKKLILALASFQAALLINANAQDDDLGDTWAQLEDDWDALKSNTERYLSIENIEKLYVISSGQQKDD